MNWPFWGLSVNGQTWVLTTGQQSAEKGSGPSRVKVSTHTQVLRILVDHKYPLSGTGLWPNTGSAPGPTGGHITTKRVIDSVHACGPRPAAAPLRRFLIADICALRVFWGNPGPTLHAKAEHPVCMRGAPFFGSIRHPLGYIEQDLVFEVPGSAPETAQFAQKCGLLPCCFSQSERICNRRMPNLSFDTSRALYGAKNLVKRHLERMGKPLESSKRG
jgi:hypothetical protein